MVSVRDWERNACYFILTLGVFFSFFTKTITSKRKKRILPIFSFSLTTLTILTLLKAQYNTFISWNQRNEIALESCIALKNIPSSINLNSYEILISPQIDINLVSTHCEHINIFNNPTEHFTKPIPNLTNGNIPSKTHIYYFEKILTYAQFFKIAPESLYKVMHSELQNQSGYHLNYVFSLHDSWYPISDGRNLNINGVSITIKKIFKLGLKPSSHKKFIIITRKEEKVDTSFLTELKSRNRVNLYITN
ncbi:hypothetical protein [Halobacteriovorax sp. JY17]|uniref:hypothetical protein n=1 Tax=Halobacteriovorax sp. JY17 TaxID=2014617 RepID=UPI0025C0B09A|nr:hypothetical protein [Halobacteriovorax sp. JY17]